MPHPMCLSELISSYGKTTLTSEFNWESEEESLDNSNPNDDLLFHPLELRRRDFTGFVSCSDDQRRISLRM